MHSANTLATYPCPRWLSPVLSALALLLVACGPAAKGASVAGQTEVRVAVAANLRFAFEEIQQSYERESGSTVTLVIGSTGSLAQQIEQGAPVDLFFAADEETVQRLREQDRIVPDTQQVYAIGHLVLAVNQQSGVNAATLEDLASPRIRTIAIANPEHAPYGRAAQQALEHSGVWERVRAKIVYGENIGPVLQFVQTGNADAAILARSVADVPEIRWEPIDASLHDPVRQAAAVVAGSPNEASARQFLAYVTGPSGRAVLERYGYTLPSE